MTAHFRGPADLKTAQAAKLDRMESSGKPGFYRAFGKRAFDILFVVLTSPIGILCIIGAVLLAALGGRFPFYLQKRVGMGGKVFYMLKIQTMVPDADAVLEAYLAQNPAARAEWDEKQKLEDDPRITRLGHILRKTSMDEMPQLWNVLKGDMSIVGPRPMMVDQRSLYPGQAYYALRPGITGLWQISDRSEGSFAGRAIFDAEYNQDLNLKRDLSILAQTAGVVLRCTGR